MWPTTSATGPMASWSFTCTTRKGCSPNPRGWKRWGPDTTETWKFAASWRPDSSISRASPGNGQCQRTTLVVPAHLNIIRPQAEEPTPAPDEATPPPAVLILDGDM